MAGTIDFWAAQRRSLPSALVGTPIFRPAVNSLGASVSLSLSSLPCVIRRLPASWLSVWPSGMVNRVVPEGQLAADAFGGTQ